MVIVTEKKLPSVLIDGDEVSKISLITPSTGFVYSGLGPDYRVLARKSRKQAQSYYNIYREVIFFFFLIFLMENNIRAPRKKNM